MVVTVDVQFVFDEPVLLEVDSVRRESIERAAMGLDGVMSIDLGGRGRKVRQKGKLRARSRQELNDKIEAISNLADGNTHTLVDSQGQSFENLRVDSVKMKNEQASGSGVIVDYETVYTQLVA